MADVTSEWFRDDEVLTCHSVVTISTTPDLVAVAVEGVVALGGVARERPELDEAVGAARDEPRLAVVAVTLSG